MNTKSAIFVEKNLKINMLKLKICKVRDHCHYIGEYRDPAHAICNLPIAYLKK